MATEIWVNFGSGNGLLPDGTKPLPEPMLTNQHLGLMAFIRGHYHEKIWKERVKTTSTVYECTKSLKIHTNKTRMKFEFLKSHPDLLGTDEFNTTMKSDKDIVCHNTNFRSHGTAHNKNQTTNMYTCIAKARGEPCPAVMSSGLNACSSQRWAVKFKFSLDP